MDWKIILATIPWRSIFLKVWDSVLPIIEEKVEDTNSVWDDKALEAVNYLIEKFLKTDQDSIDYDKDC